MTDCPFGEKEKRRVSLGYWRMRFTCGECGEYDIAPALFLELAHLSKNRLENEGLRNRFSKVPEPRGKAGVRSCTATFDTSSICKCLLTKNGANHEKK